MWFPSGRELQGHACNVYAQESPFKSRVLRPLQGCWSHRHILLLTKPWQLKLSIPTVEIGTPYLAWCLCKATRQAGTLPQMKRTKSSISSIEKIPRATFPEVGQGSVTTPHSLGDMQRVSTQSWVNLFLICRNVCVCVCSSAENVNFKKLTSKDDLFKNINFRPQWTDAVYVKTLLRHTFESVL